MIFGRCVPLVVCVLSLTRAVGGAADQSQTQTSPDSQEQEEADEVLRFEEVVVVTGAKVEQ